MKSELIIILLLLTIFSSSYNSSPKLIGKIKESKNYLRSLDGNDILELSQ